MKVGDKAIYIGTEFPRETNSVVRILEQRHSGKYHVKVIGASMALENGGGWGIAFTARAEDLEVAE